MRAKGLEFDRVVLVDPSRIVAEAERVEGLRALYVALTRATKTLVVVHAEPLPAELRLAPGPEHEVELALAVPGGRPRPAGRAPS